MAELESPLSRDASSIGIKKREKKNANVIIQKIAPAGFLQPPQVLWKIQDSISDTRVKAYMLRILLYLCFNVYGGVPFVCCLFP